MTDAMNAGESAAITALLQELMVDRDAALAALFAAAYVELHGLASAQRAKLGQPATLATTALVHEAFLKLQRAGRVSLGSRRHFYALAAKSMRQLLLDRIRAPNVNSTGLDGVCDDLIGAPGREQAWWLDLERALQRLARVDDRQVRVVELRFFAGLGDAEIADLLGINERTVRRDWDKARAWLADACADLA
ncbi:MAG: sigma-70 family RNA polymerase sigma factor [Rhodanobacteraceae bacterium]|nr:sigma-70 family RNA polymerase sigma factor [Rhodanobacteraceae bacterium]